MLGRCSQQERASAPASSRKKRLSPRNGLTKTAGANVIQRVASGSRGFMRRGPGRSGRPITFGTTRRVIPGQRDTARDGDLLHAARGSSQSPPVQEPRYRKQSASAWRIFCNRHDLGSECRTDCLRLVFRSSRLRDACSPIIRSTETIRLPVEVERLGRPTVPRTVGQRALRDLRDAGRSRRRAGIGRPQAGARGVRGRSLAA